MQIYNRISGRGTQSYLRPSDDMLVNGKSLGDIDGYRQLHVSGRGLVSQDPELVNVPARAGAFFSYTQDTVREIEVTYQLTGQSSNHLRDIYEELNNRLRGGLLSIRFIDEPEWEYQAVLSEVESKAEQSLQFVSSFKLVCPDPYKYKNQQESTGKIKLKHATEVLPETIEATVTTTTEQIAIVNGSQMIRFIGNYNAGDKLKITWDRTEITATVNTVNKLHELKFFDIPEAFYIKDGDTITGNNLKTDRVTWRDRRL